MDTPNNEREKELFHEAYAREYPLSAQAIKASIDVNNDARESYDCGLWGWLQRAAIPPVSAPAVDAAVAMADSVPPVFPLSDEQLLELRQVARTYNEVGFPKYARELFSRLGISTSVPAVVDAAPTSYVHEVPEHCDRIVHKGRYYSIELLAPVSVAQDAAGEPVARTAPFNNCQFQHCYLPGQCRAEGKCHHPVPGAWRGRGTAPAIHAVDAAPTGVHPVAEQCARFVELYRREHAHSHETEEACTTIAEALRDHAGLTKTKAVAANGVAIPAVEPMSGRWKVRERRSPAGELVDCFVEAPAERDMAYGLEVLGDDYAGYGGVERKLQHCQLIVARVNAAPDAQRTDAEGLTHSQRIAIETAMAWLPLGHSARAEIREFLDAAIEAAQDGGGKS